MLDEKERKLNELLALFQEEDEMAKLMLEQNFEGNEEEIIKKLIHLELNENLKTSSKQASFKIFEEI